MQASAARAAPPVGAAAPEASVDPRMAQRLLLVTPARSYRHAAYLDAARELGIEITFLSEEGHSLTREVADGIRVDFSDHLSAVAKVSALAHRRPFSGVVATDDSAVELAARVAAALSIPFNSPESAKLTRRKDLSRQRLREAGVPVPDHRLIDSGADLTAQCAILRFPQVLKPVSLSASRGVIRADSPHEALAACERIRRITRDLADGEERGRVLAETYIPGDEYALEAMIDDGGLTTLALFDKPEPLVGPFFEESYYITPSRLPPRIQARIEETVSRACSALGLRRGPVHAEVRLNSEGVWVLEVASRTIGGECARSLRQVLCRPLEHYVLAAAVGAPITPERKTGASGVLMIPIPAPGVLRRIAGASEAREVPGVWDMRFAVEPGQVVDTLPDAAGYLGFIYAEGQTPERVESSLRRAHGLLDIKIDPLLNHLSAGSAGRRNPPW